MVVVKESEPWPKKRLNKLVREETNQPNKGKKK
jgi:hypothetical protein